MHNADLAHKTRNATIGPGSSRRSAGLEEKKSINIIYLFYTFVVYKIDNKDLKKDDTTDRY